MCGYWSNFHLPSFRFLFWTAYFSSMNISNNLKSYRAWCVNIVLQTAIQLTIFGLFRSFMFSNFQFSQYVKKQKTKWLNQLKWSNVTNINQSFVFLFHFYFVFEINSKSLRNLARDSHTNTHSLTFIDVNPQEINQFDRNWLLPTGFILSTMYFRFHKEKKEKNK